MELLVRVRWRHVPAADLRIEVEPYHTVGDLLTAASDFCDGNWDASQPLFLERTGEQIALDVPIIESGIVSGDTLRFELYGVDHARSRVVVGSGELRRDGRPGGGPLVRAPARAPRGRPGESASSVHLDDVTVSDHQLAIIVYDDLVTAAGPRPVGDEPGRRQRPPDRRGDRRRAQRRRPVRGDCRRPARLQPHLRQRARPTRPGAVPAHAVQAGHRSGARVQAARQRPDEAGAAPLLDDHDDPPAGRRAGDVRPVPVADVPDDDAAVAAVDGRSIAGTAARAARGSSPSRSRSSASGWSKRKAEVEQALLDERAERIHQSPDLADLARRATLRTLDLWARQRRDDEFLRTRLGIGTVASKITVDPETGGEEYLREATAVTVITGYDRVPACPICVNLAELGVFGLHGALTDVRAMCSSIILQAVTLHSPEDLVLVVIEGEPQGLGAWAKWLPHTRSATSPISARHVVEDEAAAAEMIRELVSVARLRTSSDDRADHRWPWILVVLDESANVDAALASQLLDLCPQAGISVVAAVESDARVPRQAKATMGCVPQIGGTLALSTVWFTDPDVAARAPRAGAGQRPADRPGGDVAGAAARRHRRQRHHGDPARRAAALAVRTGAADRRCRSPPSGPDPSRTACARRSASARPVRSSSTSSSTARTP